MRQVRRRPRQPSRIEVHLSGFCRTPRGCPVDGRGIPLDAPCAFHALRRRLPTERREALDGWLRRCQQRRGAPNFDAIFRALLAAWFLKQEADRHGVVMTKLGGAWLRRRDRFLSDLRALGGRVAQLRREAEDPENLEAKATIADVIAGRSGRWVTDYSARLDAALKELEAAVTADAMLATPLKAPRRGAPERPWLDVEAELRVAGLTKETAEDLIRVVGLRPKPE